MSAVRTLYRYDDPVMMEFGRPLTLRTFNVFKKTPKGYWINATPYGFKKKWVPVGGKNIFAYASQKEALENYIERKKFQVAVKEEQLKFSKQNLKDAEKILEEWKEDKDAKS